MTTRQYGLGAWALMSLTILLLALVAQPSNAQHFENVHGDSCIEEGYGGRRLNVGLNAGNFISVGVTYSVNAGPAGGCAAARSDIFVVKLNRLGQVLWQRSYDIGGNDVGYDVFELTNGDVAICGQSDNNLTTSNCYSTPPTGRDAFIMRLNVNTGAVVWCCTYGTGTTDEGFRRIIQCRFAPTATRDSVGDLASTGYTFDPATGDNNGYTVRVNQNTGNLVWNNTYGGPFYDDFRSIIETRFFGRGDIVTCGDSRSFNTSGGTTDNAWIVRVNGGTGAIGLAPQGSAAYGGANINCYLWSVTEQTVTADTGKLVFAGGIYPTGLTAPEIYVLKTGPVPCTYVIDRHFGDFGQATDEASTIRELPNPPVTSLPTGVLYTTGHSYIRAGFNGDAYLMMLNPGNLTLVNPPGFHLYGAKSDEGAWYVDFVPGVLGSSTAGFYMTGRALYVGALPSLSTPPDPDQMYTLKTDMNLTTLCCDTLYTVYDSIPRLRDSCPSLRPTRFGIRCVVNPRRDTVRVWRPICNDSTNQHNCGPTTTPPTDPTRPGLGEDLSGNNGTSAVGPDGESGISGPLSINFFPNPVTVGEPVSLRCDLRLASNVAITVSDLSGVVIFRSDDDRPAGFNLVTIPTKEWRPGSYIVKVTAGNVTRSRRIVVTDK